MDTYLSALIEQTRVSDCEQQRQSALALGRSELSARQPEAIQALCELLGSEHLAVREAAENALITIGGRAVVAALIPHLKSASTTVLNYAVEILSKIGQAGIDLLTPLLDSKHHDVRKFGCDILGNLRHGDCVYDLIDLLNDPHINVAIAAGEALGKLGNAEAVPPLIRTLQHPDTWMKCIAVEALGKIGDPRAVDALMAIPREEDPIVLYTVMKALGNLPDPRVLPYVIAVLQENPRFAASALQVLENLAVQQGDDVYVQLHAAGVARSFVQLLTNEHLDVLHSAIRIVAKLRLQEAMPPLQQVLRHKDAEIAAAALAALAQIADPAVVAPIVRQILAETTDAERQALFQQALHGLQELKIVLRLRSG